MKVPQHTILNSVELKVTASEELEQEVQEELASAKAAKAEPKKMADVLKANKVSKDKTSVATSSLPTASGEGCCKGKRSCDHKKGEASET